MFVINCAVIVNELICNNSRLHRRPQDKRKIISGLILLPDELGRLNQTVGMHNKKNNGNEYGSKSK